MEEWNDGRVVEWNDGKLEEWNVGAFAEIQLRWMEMGKSKKVKNNIKG
jgi:hypothetical protein